MARSSKPRARRIPRRRRAKVSRALKSKYNVPEIASLTETVAWSNTGKCYTNTNYVLNNVSLAQTVRASVVAQGYQYYRITGITLKFKPLQDTFIQQPTGGVSSISSAPYLYIMMDRSGRIAHGGFNDAILRQLGAKPRRLDDKAISFTYKPSVLTQTFDDNVAAATATQYRISPWLPCRDDTVTSSWKPSTIDHFGVCFVADQEQGNLIQYQVEYQVQFQFKMPSVAVLTGDTPPVYGPDVELEVGEDNVVHPVVPPA